MTNEYKSIATVREHWFLSDKQMEDLIKKYENKEITHDQLAGKWNMHLEYLRKHNPKKFVEMQLELLKEI